MPAYETSETGLLATLVRPVILCGGCGCRLWPLSTSLHPKQFLDVGAETMLRATIRRTSGKDFAAPIVIAGEEHRFLVRDELHAAAVDPLVIMLEPEGRNTAAAIALACFFEGPRNRDELMLVMPSDHLIRDNDAFRRAVAIGVPAAQAGAIVTFGIQPTRAEIGYGYIEAGKILPKFNGISEVATFVEKPDPPTAEAYFQGGHHYWNSGIFLFKTSTLVEELLARAPAVASACEVAMESSVRDGDFLRPKREPFLASPSVSIDYAIMEKTERLCIVPVSMDWSDVGSWNALWEISSRDSNSNALVGQVVAVDSSGCLIRNESKTTIAAFGLTDLVIVASTDAVLVVPRARAQDLKILLSALEHAGVNTLNPPPDVHGSPDSYETVRRGNALDAKRIVLKPGKKLALQIHQRSKYWIVLAGTARVTIGQEVRLLREDESIYIAAGCVHHLENPGKTALNVLELQGGRLFDEETINPVED